ncbi:hypothetical protein MVEN_01951900 [Mycena venus]|uniref:Uncharacterized protein n=1 Tax=Mycena venus TaxID=2733690 RepID=A0A8H6XFR3_9AGAR|nr:hypothetical protein MVEN_01951900 [Mycena venus]
MPQSAPEMPLHYIRCTTGQISSSSSPRGFFVCVALEIEFTTFSGSSASSSLRCPCTCIHVALSAVLCTTERLLLEVTTRSSSSRLDTRTPFSHSLSILRVVPIPFS